MNLFCIKKIKGFSVVEIVIVISIIVLISVVIFNSFSSLRNHQSLKFDVETVVGVIEKARNQTLSSKNASEYGVHFENSRIVLFTGGVYSNNSPNNINIDLNGSVISGIVLSGGNTSVIFKRLTGETDQEGVITLTSNISPDVKTVTIYKTGVVQSQ